MEKRSLPPSSDFLQNDGAFSSIFHWLRYFLSQPPSLSPSPLIFTSSFLLLRLTWNPWIETGVTVRRSVTRVPPVVIYSACISAVVTYSAYISENRDYADRSRLSSPIRSLARSSFVREFARNERSKKRNVSPARFCPFREAYGIFPSLRSFRCNDLPARDMAGLLILIIDRGIIKVALTRGRFQLRISVSLGTIGPVGTGEREREKSGRPGREIGDEWLRRVLFVCIYCPSYLRPLLTPSGRQTAGITCEDFSD